MPGVATDERHAGFRRVECDRCAAAVLVVKFSPQHTSVQWSAASVRVLRRVQRPGGSG